MTDTEPASVGPIVTWTHDVYVTPYPASETDPNQPAQVAMKIGRSDIPWLTLTFDPERARELIEALTLCVGLADPLRPVTRWMARYAGLPAAPGPAHAIRTPDPGTPAWHSPVTYCGIVAMNSGFPSRVTWQNVTEPGHERRCAKCDRQVAVDQSS